VRAVLQRVRQASVTVDDHVVAAIGPGLLVLVGVATGDAEADLVYVSSKVSGLRVFPDEAGKMNRSVSDVGGEVLVVSQFTLLGDVRKGRRPAFDEAEAPERAKGMYELFLERLRSAGLRVASGVFQAHMQVGLINDGPVTVLVDSRRTF
jgi:D-tyrosyl-tRNA(Tyr) deacylase